LIYMGNIRLPRGRSHIYSHISILVFLSLEPVPNVRFLVKKPVSGSRSTPASAYFSVSQWAARLVRRQQSTVSRLSDFSYLKSAHRQPH